MATNDRKAVFENRRNTDLKKVVEEEMESELVFMLRTRCSVKEPPKRFMPYIC